MLKIGLKGLQFIAECLQIGGSQLFLYDLHLRLHGVADDPRQRQPFVPLPRMWLCQKC